MSKVIVMMSTYNGEKYLAEQIESILNQTERNIQLNIHDDGSIDDTVKIIRKYAKIDKRINFIDSQHYGYPKCFFKLIEQSDSAEYYAFSDQDDVWDDKKVEKAIDIIDNAKRPILYACNKKIVDENLQKIEWEDEKAPVCLEDALLKYNNVSGCTMVFNKKLRDVFLENKNPSVPYHDAYFLRLAFLFGEFYYDKNKYIKYRQHEGNVVGMEHVGARLLLDKFKQFDFSLNRYRNTNVKIYAREIYNYYKEKLSEGNKKMLEDIINIKKLKNRADLFTESRISFSPLSVYVILKVRILLGLL